jgi:beta-lactamase class A
MTIYIASLGASLLVGGVYSLPNRTGDTRLRAHLPRGREAGERTGTGPHRRINDVGLLWPPGGAPLLVPACLTEGAADTAARDEPLADVGAAVAAACRGGRAGADDSP